MGYAKYHEDDFEIREERIVEMEQRFCEEKMVGSSFIVRSTIREVKVGTKVTRRTKAKPGVNVSTEKKYVDKELTCCVCGRKFTYYADFQKKIEENGFVPPRRCKYCKKTRK